MTNAIAINAANQTALQDASWVIVHNNQVVGVYKTRTEARNAKASGIDGSVKNKSELTFEFVSDSCQGGQIEEPKVAAPIGAELTKDVHDYLCPHCGIDLQNGVVFDGEEDGQHKTIKLEKYEALCMACDGEFGASITPKMPAPKGEAKQITHVSTVERPCKAVWGIADEMKAANPTVKRSAVLAECVARGIAYYTARTQYQQWLGIQKEMAEREAQQAAGALPKVI